MNGPSAAGVPPPHADLLPAASPAQVALMVAIGWLVGLLLRRSLPHVLGLRDKTSPFRRATLEPITALLFGGLALVRGAEPSELIWYAFATLLLLVCATDYLVKLIPDRATFTGLALGVLWNGVSPEHMLTLPAHGLLAHLAGLDPTAGTTGMLLALAGAAFGFLALEAIRRTFGLAANMQVMGMGDSKLLMMIGAFLGPSGALLSLMLSFLLGVPHGLIYLKLLHQPHSPFGPPLALAAMVVLLGHGALLDSIAAFQAAVLSLPVEALATGYTVLIGIAVFLLWRTRRRAAQYEAMIEEDYRQVEEQLDDRG